MSQPPHQPYSRPSHPEDQPNQGRPGAGSVYGSAANRPAQEQPQPSGSDDDQAGWWDPSSHDPETPAQDPWSTGHQPTQTTPPSWQPTQTAQQQGWQQPTQATRPSWQPPAQTGQPATQPPAQDAQPGWNGQPGHETPALAPTREWQPPTRVDPPAWQGQVPEQQAPAYRAGFAQAGPPPQTPHGVASGPPHPYAYGNEQPGYGSQQPGYGSQQPGYGGQQPAHGGEQPGYGGGAFPGNAVYEPAGQPYPVPAAKSKMPVVLGAALTALLIGGGAGVWALTSGDDKGKPDALPATAPSVVKTTEPTPDETDPTSDGTDPEPAESEPAPDEPAVEVTVTAPKKLGGRPKLDNKQVRTATSKAERDALRDIDGATKAVAGIYSKRYGGDMVIMVAVKADMLDPAAELDGQFASAARSGMKVTKTVDVPTGALGGTAKCGKGRQDGLDLVLCGWADDGSFGLMIFGGESSVSKVKAEFVKLRPQVEKKG